MPNTPHTQHFPYPTLPIPHILHPTPSAPYILNLHPTPCTLHPAVPGWPYTLRCLGGPTPCILCTHTHTHLLEVNLLEGGVEATMECRQVGGDPLVLLVGCDVEKLREADQDEEVNGNKPHHVFPDHSAQYAEQVSKESYACGKEVNTNGKRGLLSLAVSFVWAPGIQSEAPHTIRGT